MVQQLFGLYGTKLELYLDTARKVKVESSADLDGKTVFAFRSSDDRKSCESEEPEGFNCSFVNLLSGGVASSLLLENPVGREVEDIVEAVSATVGAGGKRKVALFLDKEK